jgi:WhiB family redox-sensing transcriptional regulator
VLLGDLDDYATKGRGGITGFLLQPVEWQRDAACAELDPAIFFPERGSSSKAARALCAECTVREGCLAYALDNPEVAEFGIWGGTSPRERRVLRTSRPGSLGAREGPAKTASPSSLN